MLKNKKWEKIIENQNILLLMKEIYIKYSITIDYDFDTETPTDLLWCQINIYLSNC